MRSDSGRQHTPKQRLVVGMSGASGVILGIRALEILHKIDQIETHLVITSAAKLTIAQETDWALKDIHALANMVYKENDIGASVASGSFNTMGMIVLPCSIKTLSAIANSYADNLLVRAADVTLKEGRPLILGVRETPLHRGHLRLMDQAGRILARIGIENDQYLRWKEFENS